LPTDSKQSNFQVVLNVWPFMSVCWWFFPKLSGLQTENTIELKPFSVMKVCLKRFCVFDMIACSIFTSSWVNQFPRLKT